MRRFRKLSNPKILSFLFFLLILFTGLYFFSVKFFEKNAYDFLVKLSNKQNASTEIVNIVIDDKSIDEIGAWPWNRTNYSDIFDFLNYANAKIIVFDAILTSQEDEYDDNQFLERLSSIDNIIVGVDFSKNENLKNQQDLTNIFIEKFSIPVIDKRTSAKIKKSNYFAFREMFPNYIQTVNSIGAVNTALDTDGVVRGFEPIINMNGKYFPSLPLAVYLKTNNVKEIILNNTSYKIILENGNTRTFPLQTSQEKSVQYIKWLAPQNDNSFVAHKQFSAIDIINSFKNIEIGEPPVISPDEFRNKIVIIGATANALYDLKITPISINLSGSSIQATAIDNLLSNENMTLSNIFINVLLIIFFVGIICSLIFYLSPITSIICILFIGFLYFYILLFAYAKGFALNAITPYIFFVLSAAITYSYRFSIENYKKEKLKRAMKKYINKNIVEDIMKDNEEEVNLGGKKTEITVLMADMRGFTSISENLDPNEVSNLLNEYFDQMIPIIEQYNGVVNKFIGDAILAIFNEPIKDKNHPQNAIFCATKMLSKVQELRKKWKAEGKPDIGISIGINTGTAFVGNIGTQNHMEYTVIGDTVNVASRIEAQNRKFNTQLLISESTYEHAKDILDVIRISSVEIRGREKHIDIYEIINILDTYEAN